MLFHPLPDRSGLLCSFGFFERRNIRRRQRRRGAQKVFQNPFAARHRRGPVRDRSHQQETRLAQQAPPRVVRHWDAAEAAAANIRNPVVLGQRLVDESVVRVKQIDHAAIFAQDAFEQHLRLVPERLPQIVVKSAGFGTGALQLPQVQPLVAEVGHQRFRFLIRQHAARLLFEHRGIVQLALHGQVQKLIVGDAAPQEERQARGQFQIADAIGRAGGHARRLAFEAEDKARIDQDARQRLLDAGVEVAGLPARLIEAQQRVQIRIATAAGDRRAARAWRESSWRRPLLRLPRRVAHENAAAAGRVSGTGGIQRPGDRDALNARIAGESLPDIVRARRGFPDESRADASAAPPSPGFVHPPRRRRPT